MEMHGYVCFYRGKRIEVHAETALAAKIIATAEFKAKKSHEIAVVLAEKDGVPVVHKPLF
jgi:hypothetical protein